MFAEERDDLPQEPEANRPEADEPSPPEAETDAVGPEIEGAEELAAAGEEPAAEAEEPAPPRSTSRRRLPSGPHGGKGAPPRRS